MNVAVLLTGQLRTFEMTKHIHMNCLINPYNADVFLSIDPDNSLQNEFRNSTSRTNNDIINDAITFFKPIDTFILDVDVDPTNCHYKHMLKQYFVVQSAYKMLIKHCTNNSKKYDVIIRLRFDQFLYNKQIPKCNGLMHGIKGVLFNDYNIDIVKTYTKDKTFALNALDDNTIYGYGYGREVHYNFANDQFFFHNQSLLTKMHNFYDHIIPIIEWAKTQVGEAIKIECIFYLYIRHFNDIELKRSHILGFFIRENDY
jgi:hypothetical protein